MNNTLLSFIFTFLCLFGVHDVSAKPLTLNEILESTCRVSADGAMGSGTCVASDDNKFYVLTNAHVVNDSTNVELTYWINGSEIRYQGSVDWVKYTNNGTLDIAVISVPKTGLTSTPRVIELAPDGYKTKASEVIYSAGCPHGGWITAFIGKVRSHDGDTISFWPYPVNGRSGSGIFVNIPDSTGELHTRLVCVLAWSVDDQYGSGVSLEQIYAALKGQVKEGSKLPKGYKQVSEINDRHVLGSDGNIYCWPDGELLDLPEGVTYTKLVKDNCPGGNCPLRKRPKRPNRPTPPNNNNPAPPIGGSELKPSAPELCKQCELLKEQLDNKIKELEALQTTVSNGEKEFNDLKAKNQEALAKYTSLEQLLDSLKKDNQTTINFNAELKSKVEELSNKYVDASGKVNNLNIDIGFLNTKIKEHQNLISNQKDELIGKDSTINKVKDDLANESWWKQLYAWLAGGIASLWGGVGLFKKIKYWLVLRKQGKLALLEKITNDVLKKLHKDKPELPINLNEVKDKVDELKGGASVVADKIHDAKNIVADVREGKILEALKELSESIKETKNIKVDAPINNNLVESLIKDKEHLTSIINTIFHKDYVNQPPAVTFDANKYKQVSEVAQPTRGLGPIAPNMPEREYSAADFWNAVTQLAKDHRNEHIFAILPDLIRQKLEQPRTYR